MFAVLTSVRKLLRPASAVAAALFLSACDPSMMPTLGGAGSGGPKIDSSKPVPVALLIPKSHSSAGPVAAALENAARLAIADLNGAKIDLRVYDTAGDPSTTAAKAQAAVDAGAKIILGPLFAENAIQASLAVADEGINVVSFSNNNSIAGGNLFILGPTFANTANRLVGYARKQGKSRAVVVYSNDVPGQFGKIAIEQAATVNGVQVVSSQAYALSVEGVTATAQAAAAAVKSGTADTIFITTDATNAAMPMLLRLLPENGISPDQIQYVGMTRWDVRPDLFSLPGASGAWFAMPDQSRQNAFDSRYSSTYSTATHPLASLGYDGISAIGALAAKGRSDALTGTALTSTSFNGAGGVFRLLANGTTQRALAVAAVKDNKVVILDPAPTNLSGAGF